MKAPAASPTDGAAFYRTVWRWHFYAGLFCIPFIVWLACTGSIYLFRPQIEAWLDQRYDRPAAAQPPATAAETVRAAVAAVPGATFDAFQLPRSPLSAAQVIVARDGVRTRVYVDPETLRVRAVVPEDDRLMEVVFRLHGELLMGAAGSIAVELAASWAIVMIVTGLYLWWPRRAAGLAGIVYPRLGQGGRVLWRDLHAVTGVWVSAFALFILLSGLPWAKSWGSYLQAIRHVAGESASKPDWPIGGVAQSAAVAEMPGMTMTGAAAPTQPVDDDAIDRVIAAVKPLDLAFPVLVSPPRAPGAPWTAKSDAQNRPLRSDLTLDGRTGAILGRTDFDQRPAIDRIVGFGVAAHEGQLFGWANQLLSLFTALGLVVMSVGAVMLWWRRREGGVLGAPPALGARVRSVGLATVIVGLAVLLPLLGLSMILVLVTERLVLRRLPGARRWLGLRPADAA
jgi:uncharacterized iron-regulated membrane protein